VGGGRQWEAVGGGGAVGCAREKGVAWWVRCGVVERLWPRGEHAPVVEAAEDGNARVHTVPKFEGRRPKEVSWWGESEVGACMRYQLIPLSKNSSRLATREPLTTWNSIAVYGGGAVGGSGGGGDGGSGGGDGGDGGRGFMFGLQPL
jgi:hypothetical protein